MKFKNKTFDEEMKHLKKTEEILMKGFIIVFIIFVMGLLFFVK